MTETMAIARNRRAWNEGPTGLMLDLTLDMGPPGFGLFYGPRERNQRSKILHQAERAGLGLGEGAIVAAGVEGAGVV